MKNFADYEKELKNSPKRDRLMEAANSAEGRRLAAAMDTEAIEKAARSGDSAALKNILAQVLSSPDGQALAKKISGLMKE